MAGDSTDQTITDAIHTLVPGAKITSIAKAPIPGFYEVVASGQVVYVSADGKYLLQGKLYDLVHREDLTAARMNTVRKAALAKLPASQKLVFSPSHPKYTVNVFTDIDCGYCRQLHQHMAAFNEAGIAVDYLFFPRTGLGTSSYDKAVSVWCASDRHDAFTAAMGGTAPAPASCDNPVASEYASGLRLGVTGTPTIIASDGSIIGGYMTPQQMLAKLRQVKSQNAEQDGG